MQGVQAGGDINIHHEEHHHPAGQLKEEIVPPDLYHLPKPTTALIGRKTELAQLTEAIKNPKIRLAIIVAAGGIGKSALTDEWLQQIAQENYYGKTRVFGWSFYSQDLHNTFTNSQPFFDASLKFFKKEIPEYEFDKAKLLIECLEQQPCLLILDGLEPLQHSEDLKAMSGELQDVPLKTFLFQLRFNSCKSFVLFSSRQPLVELKKWQADHYLSLDLKTLPHDDGADLLQALDVTGNATERQAISQDLNGHALSLVLMGHLLSEHYQGDYRYAKELPPLTSAHGNSEAEKDSRQALRVLDYYDSLQDDTSRRFLQFLGLFDRPMSASEKAVLIANANHAELLRALTAKQWQTVEQRLEKSGVLLGKKSGFYRSEWDTHPIIRAYFGQQFKENYSEAFKQAHSILFEHFQNSSEKEFPDTLPEMQFLYRAVVHGCLAGEYQRSLDEVYIRRIQRGDAFYSVHKLGAYSENFTALAAFFTTGWMQLAQTNLNRESQAWLFGSVSFNLMSLGRLQEAIELREVQIKLSVQLKNWKDVSIGNQNLVELYLALGQLKLAHIAAQHAIVYAQHSETTFEQVRSESYLATSLHRRGDFGKAYEHFQKAEDLEQQRGNQYLNGLANFHYCTLLLDSTSDKVAWNTVMKRAEYSLEVPYIKGWLLTTSSDYLILARIYVALNDTSKAENAYKEAIQTILKAKKENYTPPFYLYRADFYLTQNQLAPALADLNSAYEIIELRDMKLYLVDYLLIHGRYCLVTEDFDTALNHYIEAEQLIQETGYHLRDAELDLFAAQICFSTKQNFDSKNAEHYLQKAKNRIEEIGQYGLIPRWEKVSESGF